MEHQEIHIDVNLIPEEVKESLCRAAYEFVLRTLEQPGGREATDAKKRELGLMEDDKS